MDIGIPGWEAELTFSNEPDGKLTVVALARRTSLDPPNGYDVWMHQYGQQYLNELLDMTIQKTLKDVEEHLAKVEDATALREAGKADFQNLIPVKEVDDGTARSDQS